ncbi:TetR/AcrR family transcriptional regulator [Bradyrhizobium sp. LHD-71]|uniref:TetR/AcrR family transcriptional regulator n=1 Tax=Bradyrhizobium sp. LHD-71 TaxID=3072141 RepID=UPI00280C777A|nr:TetR/AcrR family transcriptional regulator [Bradyrhizobium sp. LHD-71]MDQ8730251.1 TetR/AcrR family transcriptional regulator [Bradyrhizobium sp. LHD-71]
MSVTPKSMSIRRTSIGARRNPESEAAVLQAARQLLLEKGYAGFSIEEVARRAGAGKPTIYRWWPTKADLFIAIYGAEKSATVVLPDHGDLARDLTHYTADLWRFWRDHPAGSTFKGLIAEAQGSEAALDALRTKFLPERLEPVRTLFERAAARGELRKSEIADRVQLWVGFSWFRLLTDQINDDDRLIRRVMTLLAR